MGSGYLPIGTIVILKKNNQKIMITGYFCGNEKKIYEYTGCFYPEGIKNGKYTIGFNQRDIKKILYMGMKDEEYKNFEEQLINISKKYTEIMYKITNRMIYKAIEGDNNG